MKASEKVFFILGVILALAAVLAACLSAYFGIAALVTVHAHGAKGVQSIGVAFAMVFMIIFGVISMGAALVSALLLGMRSVRSAVLRIHRTSRILLWLLLSLAVFLIALFVLCVVLI